MSNAHSRAGSDDTTCSASSYQLVLEHMLQYPASYEIPLRTMYTLNCVSRAQPLPKQLSRAPSPTEISPISGQFAWSEAGAATASFTSALLSQVASLPSQPTSLPPSFTIPFISRCFPIDRDLADFSQALTALDYLKDFENRRRKEIAAVFERLDVHPGPDGTLPHEISEKFPGVALWVKNIQAKNKKADSYYGKLYIGLRRWIMVNELETTPFSRLNCVGMLNTLYPPPHPNAAKVPTAVLSSHQLEAERTQFFDYIRRVERSGNGVLKSIKEHNKAPGDIDSWPSIAISVDKYLRVANNVIEDCVQNTGMESFTPTEEPGKRKGKKTDSGVSFGSERRPSTGATTKDKPLTEPKTPKGRSTLEKLTREFKRMRVKTRPDVEEIVKIDKHPADSDLNQTGVSKMKKSLRKARSMATLTSNKAANGSMTSLVGSRKGSEVAEFDAVEMRHHRQLYEASTMKRH